MKICHTLISKLCLTCCAFGSGSTAAAQALPDFRCTVHSVISAPSLEPAEQRMLHSIYVGKKFTIERRTGYMAGILKIFSPVDPQIIDLGSSENSFKMVASMRLEQGAGAGTAIYSLVVNTFDPSSFKPFLFTYNSTAYVGTCVTS